MCGHSLAHLSRVDPCSSVQIQLTRALKPLQLVHQHPVAPEKEEEGVLVLLMLEPHPKTSTQRGGLCRAGVE